MPIISVSLNDDNIASLDEIQKEYGLNGRSEAIRAAIRAAEAEVRETKNMSGTVEGVLIIVRKDHSDPWISIIQQKFEKEIKTQLHSHLENHNCLEIMLISSDAETMSKMLKDIKSTGKADYIKFVRG